MKFRDIPQFTREGSYRVNTSWDYIEDWIERHADMGLNLDPDYQRGHVWTVEQQIAYVEFCLRGGKGSNELRFNCPGWMGDFRGPFELVDGKQRLTAVRLFLADELLIFDGMKCSDFEGKPHHVDFIIMVNDLPDRRDVLKWYLEINDGGTPHTVEELDKVRKLLEDE